MRLFIILWDEEKWHSDIICGRRLHLSYSPVRKWRIWGIQWDGPMVNWKITYGSLWPKQHMMRVSYLFCSTSQNLDEHRLVSSKGKKYFFLRGSRKALECEGRAGYPEYLLWFVCLLISAYPVIWLEWNVAVSSLRSVWDLETKLAKMSRKHQLKAK